MNIQNEVKDNIEMYGEKDSAEDTTNNYEQK